MLALFAHVDRLRPVALFGKRDAGGVVVPSGKVNVTVYGTQKTQGLHNVPSECAVVTEKVVLLCSMRAHDAMATVLYPCGHDMCEVFGSGVTTAQGFGNPAESLVFGCDIDVPLRIRGGTERSRTAWVAGLRRHSPKPPKPPKPQRPVPLDGRCLWG